MFRVDALPIPVDDLRDASCWCLWSFDSAFCSLSCFMCVHHGAKALSSKMSPCRAQRATFDISSEVGPRSVFEAFERSKMRFWRK